jgi:circadian clock protein KaiB
VIDIYQHAGQLAAGQVVVAPTLVRQNPLPVRKLVGDLTSRNRILEGLEIISSPTPV